VQRRVQLLGCSQEPVAGDGVQPTKGVALLDSIHERCKRHSRLMALSAFVAPAAAGQFKYPLQYCAEV
jgi:hypothetical protein